MNIKLIFLMKLFTRNPNPPLFWIKEGSEKFVLNDDGGVWHRHPEYHINFGYRKLGWIPIK